MVFGNWARAAQSVSKQVHRHSDLDIYALSGESLKRRPVDFTDRLRNNGIGIYVDCVGSFIYKKRKEVLEYFRGDDSLINDNYVIVTPYPEVRQTLEEILARQK